jgi:hypothetical protein
MLRYPVLVVFAIALAVRVGGAIVVHVLPEGAMSLDDLTYSRVAGDMAAGRTAQWDAHTRWLYWSTATLLLPLTLLYSLFGPVSLLGQGLVALAGAGAAALVTRISLERLPCLWAIVAGVVMALLPSQVLWSALILKDAVVWVTLCGLALTVACAARMQDRRLLLVGLPPPCCCSCSPTCVCIPRWSRAGRCSSSRRFRGTRPRCTESWAPY